MVFPFDHIDRLLLSLHTFLLFALDALNRLYASLEIYWCYLTCGLKAVGEKTFAAMMILTHPGESTDCMND